MAKILITGGTGLIGTQLTKILLSKGYEVVYLSRHEKLNAKVKAYKWNVDTGDVDQRAFENVSYIIHLAGAGIADKRWTKERKQEVIDSRVKSTTLIVEALKRSGSHLKAFVGATAIGIYGMQTNDHLYIESDKGHEDYLSHCCELWEKSYSPIEEMGVRLVKVRVGVVLSGSGGALEKMVKPVKLGIGSALGSGKQIVPWIHIDDICGIFIKAIEDEKMKGTYNGVAPSIITNNELTHSIAKVLHKPYFMPKVPAFVLRMMFGEMGSMFLEGSAVSAEKVRNSGYNFKFMDVRSALEDLFLKK